MPEPIQLPLFPEAASLTRIRLERNESRYYRLEVWPDLFGRALLARHWGRIGTQGRMRLDPYPDAGAAVNALANLARSKRRRSIFRHWRLSLQAGWRLWLARQRRGQSTARCRRPRNAS